MKTLLYTALLTAVGAARAPGDTRPNIIVFFPDTIRAEALSTYGHALTKTPNADRLAAEGVVFEQAHVQHTQCSPSRCAIMTGRYMHVMGHRTQTHLVQEWEPNVFAYLKASGYTTLMLGKNDMLAVDSWNKTFTYWENVIGIDGGANKFKQGEPGYYSFASFAGKTLGNNSKQNEDLLAVRYVGAFMANDPPEPFAIWVSGIGAHPPYTAPADYYHMYTAEQVMAAAPLRPVLPNANKPAFIGPSGIPGYRSCPALVMQTTPLRANNDPPPHFPSHSNSPPNTPGDLNGFNDTFFYELAAVYLGRVSYTDYVLGALLDGIAASPLVGNTALIFSSDHGDFSGDYHNVEKYPCSLDDMLTRVPLIGRVPGGAKGARVAAPVEALDIFATLLDLAGLLPNATSALTSRTIERHFSQSLLPALMGSASAPPPKKYVYSEGGYTPGSLEVEPLDPEQESVYSNTANMYYPRGMEELNASHCTRAIMQRSLTAKLVYRPAPGQSELYDLANDPVESLNVWGAVAIHGAAE